MSMKKKSIALSILVLLTVFFVGTSLMRAGYFTRWDGKTRMSDVTREDTITLSGKGEIVGLSVLITGHIDGTAIVKQSYEGKDMYTYEIGPGKVHLYTGGDWYGNECIIKYKPRDVKSGTLEIKYQFRRL